MFRWSCHFGLLAFALVMAGCGRRFAKRGTFRPQDGNFEDIPEDMNKDDITAKFIAALDNKKLSSSEFLVHRCKSTEPKFNVESVDKIVADWDKAEEIDPFVVYKKTIDGKHLFVLTMGYDNFEEPSACREIVWSLRISHPDQKIIRATYSKAEVELMHSNTEECKNDCLKNKIVGLLEAGDEAEIRIEAKLKNKLKESDIEFQQKHSFSDYDGAVVIIPGCDIYGSDIYKIGKADFENEGTDEDIQKKIGDILGDRQNAIYWNNMAGKKTVDIFVSLINLPRADECRGNAHWLSFQLAKTSEINSRVTRAQLVSSRQFSNAGAEQAQ